MCFIWQVNLLITLPCRIFFVPVTSRMMPGFPTTKNLFAMLFTSQSWTQVFTKGTSILTQALLFLDI